MWRGTTYGNWLPRVKQVKNIWEPLSYILMLVLPEGRAGKSCELLINWCSFSLPPNHPHLYKIVYSYSLLFTVFYSCRLHLKCDGTRWRKGGEVKGKLANGVGSQYSSHYLGTWFMQYYHRWWSTHQLPVVDWTDAPSADLNGLVRFARNTKSGFCPCAITFQLASTTRYKQEWEGVLRCI